MELPPLPVPAADFVSYVNGHPDTRAGVAAATRPFVAFESKLREVYAQHPTHPTVTANHLVPVFTDTAPPTIRARNLTTQSPAEKDRYLLPLDDDLRRRQGSPATVASLKEFRTNFNLFSELSLVELDWSNVVVAGSAVVTSLLPVDAPHNQSKRALRSYYHEKLAPASDVDLFIYGLDEEQAIAKIKQIETKIRDAILAETTAIRTKNTITIVSEYPTRHVQIVLRLYKSVSEILTGFDVDCSGVAFDGEQVWATPRALAAFMTQMNTIDLTRRSPSYENRLSKYSHRGFEVYWPQIDRSRIDPTIFERSFTRVQGLARLLVLEKLPHPDDRETYLAKRRAERGRPALPFNAHHRRNLPGNIKMDQPDDVAEWVDADEVSDYHTIAIPYGPRYNAKRIEKLLFTKDLLLNAEWNKPKDREANIHRHPAFFGPVSDILSDCCGYCPVPTTDADLAALEDERKIYISGTVAFLQDDPGRQAIGSFHPLTDDDWTEMAYVGNTTRLCQAIVDQDLDAVRDWFASPEVVDVNRRDHTGRTPLQLAVMCSTPEIVQCLIEHGARLVARLYNGMTALHIAAHRGQLQMVRDILDKSAANEEEESRKEDARKLARRAAAPATTPDASQNADPASEDVTKSANEDTPSEHSSFDELEDDEHDDDDDGMTEGSFIKVRDPTAANDALADDANEPDVYDVDVLAWDSPLSPLHLAIIGGHLDVVDLLIAEYGADVLLPVKIFDQNNRKNAKAAILSIVLAMELPLQKANETVKMLVGHGATATQADMGHVTALHYVVNAAKSSVLEILRSTDAQAFEKACNFVTLTGWTGSLGTHTPLLTAIRTNRMEVVQYLLDHGAKSHIDYDDFALAYTRKWGTHSTLRGADDMKITFEQQVDQPIVQALKMENAALVTELLDQGESVNTLPAAARNYLVRPHQYDGQDQSMLDILRARIKSLQDFLDPTEAEGFKRPENLEDDEQYLVGSPGSYKYWTAYHDLRDAKLVRGYQVQRLEQELDKKQNPIDRGTEAKRDAVRQKLSELQDLDKRFTRAGAKSFYELHPDAKKPDRPAPYYERYYTHTPYATDVSFQKWNMTDQEKSDYLKLFEAAWTGDADTVRSLCVTHATPLEVSQTDLRGFNPFIIAALRGHYDLARLIVEIAKAQYLPSESEAKYRYTLQAEEDPYDYRSDTDDSCDGGSDDVMVRAQLIKDTFTIDDVTTLADTVKSKTSPSTMIFTNCRIARCLSEDVDPDNIKCVFGPIGDPAAYVNDYSEWSWEWFHAASHARSFQDRHGLIRYAIFTDNFTLLKFVIRTGNELESQKDGDENLKAIKVHHNDFRLAVELGRVEMISEIIKSTGHGFPLERIVKKSKVHLDLKPKTYQGLTVHGRKRTDWAEEGRKGYRHRIIPTSAIIPVLDAVMAGDVEVAEYYLSDAPLRRYLEFTDTFKDDKRLQGLAQQPGGIKGVLNTWLSTRNELLLHLAVASPPRQDGSQPIFDFMLEKYPHLIEVRAANGMTPLQIALGAGRYFTARKLIAAGANQATRAKNGANILHTVLENIEQSNAVLLKSVFAMLDQELVPKLLLERCGGADPGSLTPLAVFLNRPRDDVKYQSSVELILTYSQGQDLERMDGAGDYALHKSVRACDDELTKLLVEYRPSLLYLENATGMTPFDVALTGYLKCQIDIPPALVEALEHTITKQAAQDFAERSPRSGEDREDSNRTGEWEMYRLVEGLVAKYPAKRKLVSLNDANEVAKRLAQQQHKRSEERRRRLLRRTANNRQGYGQVDDGSDSDSEDDGSDDEVGFFAKNLTRHDSWDKVFWLDEQGGSAEAETGEPKRKVWSPVRVEMKKNPFFMDGQMRRLATWGAGARA